MHARDKIRYNPWKLAPELEYGPCSDRTIPSASLPRGMGSSDGLCLRVCNT